MADISPIKWAEKIGKRPQIVYGWIRNQGLPAHPDPESGKQMLDEDQANQWHETYQKTRKSHHSSQENGEKEVAHNFVRPKQIVRYERLPKTGLQAVAQIDQVLEHLIYMKKSNGVEFPFLPEDLKKRLKKGDIIIEDPEDVLFFVIDEFEARNKTEFATTLKELCAKFGIDRGRSTRKELKVGICDEHGGDPDRFS